MVHLYIGMINLVPYFDESEINYLMILTKPSLALNIAISSQVCKWNKLVEEIQNVGSWSWGVEEHELQQSTRDDKYV